MMMLLSLPVNYPLNQKKFIHSPSEVSHRSYSDEQILWNSTHRRSQSADLFSLVVPPINDSSLICSICSLPMIKPTLLPCQHTFCYHCLETQQHIRSGSLPNQENSSLCHTNDSNQMKTIVCQKCSRVHQIRSLNDLKENQSMELLINTLLCEECHQLSHPNQVDTCCHCYGVFCKNCYSSHLKSHGTDSKCQTNISPRMNTKEEEKSSNGASDQNIFHPRSFDHQTKFHEQENQGKTSPDEEQTPTTKKKSSFKNWLNSPRNRSLNVATRSFKETTNQKKSSVEKCSSLKLRRRAKVSIEIKPETMSTEPESSSSSVPVPMTPLGRFKNLYEQFNYTDQHIKKCRKRQLELDRAVGKLIEILTLKTNENLHRISQYWFRIKQLSIEKYQSKHHRFPLLNSLWRSCCASDDIAKQFDAFIERNDELTAALQVLFTTLTIVNNEYTTETLQQLFHREEQTTLRSLRRIVESLLWTYSDELTFITERIRVYDNRFTSWKNSNISELESISHEWTQVIEHDYPTLIEKISNDFVSKVPQIETILLQMMKNMKKRLLHIDTQNSPRRTSVC